MKENEIQRVYVKRFQRQMDCTSADWLCSNAPNKTFMATPYRGTASNE